jgi:hypothetical protein
LSLANRKFIFGAFLAFSVLISSFTAPEAAFAQASSQKEDMKKAASFYLTVRCNEFHRADFIWDPAITVARWQGLQNGDSIPKDLMRVLKQTSKSDQQDAQRLLSYKWPNSDIQAAISEIANDFLGDSRDIANIASSNKWRVPNWSEWWKKDEAMLKRLGLSEDTPCPGWDYTSFDAFRYLSAVCPANRAWKRFEKVRDRELDRGMKIGDSISPKLKDEMLITALYLKRSFGALEDFRSKDSRVNRLALEISETEYRESVTLTRVAKGGKWEEPPLASGGTEASGAIRRALNLPPVGSGSCPI